MGRSMAADRPARCRMRGVALGVALFVVLEV